MVDIDSAEQVNRILAVNDGLVRRLQTVTPEVWSRRPATDEWTAAEIVGHMIELEVHWARAAAAIAAQPGQEVGRPLEDPERLAGPEGGAVLGLQEAIDRLQVAGQTAAAIVQAIPAGSWSTTGLREGKAVTVGQIVENSIIGHAQTHVEQCLAALSSRQPS